MLVGVILARQVINKFYHSTIAVITIVTFILSMSAFIQNHMYFEFLLSGPGFRAR